MDVTSQEYRDELAKLTKEQVEDLSNFLCEVYREKTHQEAAETEKKFKKIAKNMEHKFYAVVCNTKRDTFEIIYVDKVERCTGDDISISGKGWMHGCWTTTQDAAFSHEIRRTLVKNYNVRIAALREITDLDELNMYFKACEKRINERLYEMKQDVFETFNKTVKNDN